MNYAKAMHSKNPICMMPVMQHRMFSCSCKLSLSKRVLVQVFRDMGDEVGWYPELGSSELEHVLNDVVPSTGIAAPAKILCQPQYTTHSTPVFECLDDASLGSNDICSHSSETVISNAPAPEGDPTQAEDGTVNNYPVTPECSTSESLPVAPLASIYTYSSKSSDAATSSAPLPAAVDLIPADDDTILNALALEESSDAFISSTPTPAAADPMPAEDDIADELASEELSDEVTLSTPTPAAEVDPMPAEDVIVDELPPEDPAISPRLTSDSEGNQCKSEPLGSVWMLDDRYPNAGPVHCSTQMALQPQLNYRF